MKRSDTAYLSLAMLGLLLAVLVLFLAKCAFAGEIPDDPQIAVALLSGGDRGGWVEVVPPDQGQVFNPSDSPCGGVAIGPLADPDGGRGDFCRISEPDTNRQPGGVGSPLPPVLTDRQRGCPRQYDVVAFVDRNYGGYTIVEYDCVPQSYLEEFFKTHRRLP